MAAPTKTRPDLSKQASFEEVEDDHFRKARLRREARDASPGGWRYKRSLHVDELERNVLRDLDKPSLQSNDCAVRCERPERGSGVNLIIQSDTEASLVRYMEKLRDHYTRAPKAAQQHEARQDKVYKEIININLRGLEFDDIVKHLSKPDLKRPNACQVTIQKPSKGVAGWNIVVETIDSTVLQWYPQRIREYFATLEAAAQEHQRELQAILQSDPSRLSELIERGLLLDGTGLPLHAERLAKQSRQRSVSNSSALPRRPILSASNSRDGSPASRGSQGKTAQFGPKIHRQTIRLQGYYKGDLSPERASAWLTRLSNLCRSSTALSAVLAQSTPEEGHTIAFSGTGKDLDIACNDVKRCLLSSDSQQVGHWQVKSAEGALDIYEWCPALQPPPVRPFTDRRDSLRPQSSTAASGTVPRRASVQVPAMAREPEYASHPMSAQQRPPPKAAPRRPSLFRHVSEAEARELLPRQRRASSAAKSSRPHPKQPAERTKHTYGINSTGTPYPTAPSSTTTASSNTRTGDSVFSAPSRASTISSAPFSAAPLVEIVPTQSRGPVRVETRAPASRIEDSYSYSSTSGGLLRPSSRRQGSETTLKVIRTRRGLALSRPTKR